MLAEVPVTLALPVFAPISAGVEKLRLATDSTPTIGVVTTNLTS